MRVLWFTNILMPSVHRHFDRTTMGGGHWMSALFESLKNESDIQLAVATAHPGLKDTHFCDKGIDYFVIGQPRRLSHLSFRQQDLRRCKEIIMEWRPDLVHIHGTERFYGLLVADNDLNIPIVISIQGLLYQYLRHFFGNLSCVDVLRCQSVRSLLTGRGRFFNYLRFMHGAERERHIISNACNFLGRTNWDKASVYALNKDARYFHVGELLRPEFYQKVWSVDRASRHSIIFTNVKSPIKGVETLLEAAAFLKRDFPSVKVRLGGSMDIARGYGRLVARRISELGLDGSVELLGYLDGGEMAEALARSHVFCIPSLIENSPNSLCEAQLVGMPCVASYVGGIPCLIEEAETGLLFPSGDSALLAKKLRDIFESDELAVKLGQAARKTALRRHDSNIVKDQILAAYKMICS